MADSARRVKVEAIVFAVLFGLGVFALPGMIFLVGVQVFGDYEGDNGVWSLYSAILSALGNGAIPAWLLVLSPYLVIQLCRLLAALHRARRS